MIKNIVKVLVSNFLITAIGLINSFVFPIIMSVEGYSAYHEFTLYVSYVNVCHLGIASGMFIYYGGKDYKQIDKKRYKSEISLIFLVLGVFTTLGMIASIIMQSSLFFKVAIVIYPVCMIASFKALYQAWNRFTAYSVINVITTAALTVWVLILYAITGAVDGNTVIGIYLIVQYAVFLYFLIEYFIFTRKVKALPLFSKENLDTTKTGFLIMAGNYIMLIFHALDKQFVNVLYSTYSFAMYSFACSTTNIMNVFISAMATPFYPKLAQQKLDHKQMNMIKEVLFIFGAYSGCAYFVVAFIVNHFITKYVDSLILVYLFFAAFPASAVINVLYVNLYKVTKQVKKYIITLIGVVCVAAGLNGVAVLLKGDYVGISIATLCTYYIWLFYSQRDFKGITIKGKDYGYLTLFCASYLMCIWIQNEIIGILVFGVVITAIDLLFYRESMLEAWNLIKEKVFRKKSCA